MDEVCAHVQSEFIYKPIAVSAFVRGSLIMIITRQKVDYSKEAKTEYNVVS